MTGVVFPFPHMHAVALVDVVPAFAEPHTREFGVGAKFGGVDAHGIHEGVAVQNRYVGVAVVP